MAHNPIRIMYIDTSIEMAGGQYSLLTLLKHLDRSKYVPLVYVPARSRLRKACEDLGIETHRLPFRSVHRASRARSALIARLEDGLRSFVGTLFLAGSMGRKHVDVVHANTFKAALVASFACRLARKPLVFHDRIMIRHGMLGKMVARMARRIIAVSSGIAGAHGEALRSKVRLVYDGVDTDYMSPDKVSPNPDPGRERRVCYLGRISWEKGLDSLVEAAKLVTDRLPGTKFLIGGSPYTPDDASYQQDLVSLVDSLGLAGSVVFKGLIDDVRAFMMMADVVVLPSRREALGLSLLEAMALEKAVVAFAVDGPREIITDRKDGLLVEPDNVEQLAGAVVTMLDDRDFARQAGRMGRETVISRFSSTTFAGRISEIYDEIAGGEPE
jgi:glycosyltransferase involved in cell wall biosynthesis